MKRRKDPEDADMDNAVHRGAEDGMTLLDVVQRLVKDLEVD